ncbi:hypothetical protein B0H66DRAFT_591532 [Apodospora peruviana]|uniref:DUF7703 domain-containing protein n=1 Tax=Apodospora peruviana TaxID=516989 RepID=A0AAE0I5W3_9PEZI|nr:hypothetical protein B0H66DRAFT_591532 [Apodospora peruviana]
MVNSYTIEVVPFDEYDWTFLKPGWLNLNAPTNLSNSQSPTAVGLISAFCAVAFWMSLELLVLVHITFKRKRGLYFWSIIITTLGFILQTAGYLLKFFKNDWPRVLVAIIFSAGRICNVTGFAVVLWSRLHLIVNDRRILRAVLALIVATGVSLHTPTVVFRFCLLSAPVGSDYRWRLLYGLEAIERAQQTVFAIQETAISGLYIFYTSQVLRNGFASSPRRRKVMWTLIAVQVIAILLDAGLTTFDYMNMFTLKCALHPAVYSVKLKMEFIVLNQLLTVVKKRGLAPRPGLLDEKYSGSGGRSGTPPMVNRMVGMMGTTTTCGTAGRDGSSVGSKALLTSSQESKIVATTTRAVSSTLVYGVGSLPPVHLSTARAETDDGGSCSSSSKNTSVTNVDSIGSTGDEEQDIMDLAGQPDEEEGAHCCEDECVVGDSMERQYLGRFGA